MLVPLSWQGAAPKPKHLRIFLQACGRSGMWQPAKQALDGIKVRAGLSGRSAVRWFPCAAADDGLLRNGGGCATSFARLPQLTMGLRCNAVGNGPFKISTSPQAGGYKPTSKIYLALANVHASAGHPLGVQATIQTAQAEARPDTLGFWGRRPVSALRGICSLTGYDLLAVPLHRHASACVYCSSSVVAANAAVFDDLLLIWSGRLQSF